MPPSRAAHRSATVLTLGREGTPLARCDAGLLEIEYALFDPGDLELRADAIGVREIGYATTAKSARERLARLGATADVATRAAAELSAVARAGYARGALVRVIVPQLEASEIFEGGAFDAATRRYAGVWLDTDRLVQDLGVDDGGNVLQALHLAALLAEVDDDAPLFLDTGGDVPRRPGERTYRRVRLDGMRDVFLRLATVAPMEMTFEGPSREELAEHVRARATACASVRAERRLAHLEEVLASVAPPPTRARDELRLLEQQLASGDLAAAERTLDAIERVHFRPRGGRPSSAPRSDAPPRRIAERLAALAEERGGVEPPELQLLAARAWLHAGDEGHARYFARLVAEDASADDRLRLAALDVLESTQPTARSHLPPAPESPRVAPAAPAVPHGLDPPAPTSAPPLSAPPPSSPPRPYRTPPPSRRRVEAIDELAPPFAHEPPLAPDAVPRTPDEARVVCTRVARELGRVYRERDGVALATNALAVELMQRHLVATFADGASGPELDVEVARHGALFSEILARSLGARWEDVSSPDRAAWSMLVENVRVFPFERVARFVEAKNREKDLVELYLELDAVVRGRQP